EEARTRCRRRRSAPARPGGPPQGDPQPHEPQPRRPRPCEARLSPRGRLRHALVAAGAHRVLELLWRAERARAALGARFRGLRALLRRAALYAHYALQRRRPLDDRLAVFSAYWNRGYSCNPAAIEAKARELMPGLRTAWVCGPAYAHTLPPGVRRISPGSAAHFTALARARFLVSNVNLPHRYVKRAGQTLLMTHHGTPLKHMGLDLLPYPAAADGMDFGRLLEHSDRWDYSLSANPHSTRVWERAFPSPYTTLEFGYPRNDVFQTATADDVARVRAELGIPAGATAVLYAPTHRDYRRGGQPWLDLARLVAELGPRFVVLVRAHYFHAGRRLDCLPPGGLIDVSGHPSVEELCLASDVLVTDYSSLMFDYANLDRPLVVHAPDWETYRDARGTYFDITAMAPGPVARGEDELIDLLATGAWATEHSRRLRAAFRERFCPWDDGHAAERVVRHVFLGEAPDQDRSRGQDRSRSQDRDQSRSRSRGRGRGPSRRGVVPPLVPPVVPLAERRPAPAPGPAPETGPAPGAAPDTGPTPGPTPDPGPDPGTAPGPATPAPPAPAPLAAKDWWSCPASASSYRCSRSRATCASASTRYSASPSPTSNS
ncbi:CDP-glycerol glycerophosphotransferase family protein, partial [Streptomyces albus subsp. chlorinus]